MSKKIIMNSDFFEKEVKFLNRKVGIDAKPEDVMLAIKASYEYLAEVLGKNKSEEEEVAVELPGYITFSTSYRENGGTGNFGMAISAGEELTKKVKEDDDMLDDDEE